MSTVPTLREMMDHGVHFGHVTARWNPKMKPYIFTSRDKVHVINLEQTREKLKDAVNFISRTVAHGGTVLFVGTKPHAKDIVKAAAVASGMPHMTERWFGGTMTNFNIMRANVKTLEDIEHNEASGKYEHLTKSERLKIDEKKRKLDLVLSGIRNMAKLPNVLVVVDSVHEQIAVSEAKSLGIPVVAIVDTNADPSLIDYAIPANDDAARSLTLLMTTLSRAIIDARGSMTTPVETDVPAEAKPAAKKVATEK